MSSAMTVNDNHKPISLVETFTADISCPRYPRRGFAGLIWRWRVWIETTAPVCMLEPWEANLIYLMWALVLVALVTGTIKYLPHHLYFLQRRATYYILGHEGDVKELVQRMGQGVSSLASSLSHQEL